MENSSPAGISQGILSSQAQIQLLSEDTLIAQLKTLSHRSPTLFLTIHVPVSLGKVNEASKHAGKSLQNNGQVGEVQEPPGAAAWKLLLCSVFPCPSSRDTFPALIPLPVPRKMDQLQLPALNHEQGLAELV